MRANGRLRADLLKGIEESRLSPPRPVSKMAEPAKPMAKPTFVVRELGIGFAAGLLAVPIVLTLLVWLL